MVAVAAAILWNEQRDALLLSQRPTEKHQGGLWEFPGGKIELGESAEQALTRELLEELNITVEQMHFFQHIDYAYSDKNVQLFFYHCYGVSNTVRSNEGQQWRWVSVDDLALYAFPAANQPIINALLAKNDR